MPVRAHVFFKMLNLTIQVAVYRSFRSCLGKIKSLENEDAESCFSAAVEQAVGVGEQRKA